MSRPLPMSLPLPPETFALRMDAGAWAAPLLDIEADRFAAQTALKSQLLARNSSRSVCCLPDAGPLIREALTRLLTAAADDWPQWFTLKQAGAQWIWSNRLTGKTTAFRPGEAETLPQTPLNWLGRQFQEDIVLLDKDGVCAAGSVCFPSGWSLAEKIGRPFGDVHAAVPGFAGGIGHSADQLLQRLKPHRPVGRWNWTFPATSRLALDPAEEAVWGQGRAAVTPENAGQRCFLRTERQTLSRLPQTSGLLFTIHTYLTPIETLAADPETRRRLCAHLQSLPPTMVEYRGMTGYIDALITYFNFLF